MKTLEVFQNNIFRPLLLLNDNELNILYNSTKRIFFEDESNVDSQYLRNRIRANILPLLLQEGLDPYKLYINFHPDTGNLLPTTTNSGSMISIDASLLSGIYISQLKIILDISLKSRKLHPLKSNFLYDLFANLLKGDSFQIENAEAYFYRFSDQNLQILPKNSPMLVAPVISMQNGQNSIHWNRQNRIIPVGMHFMKLEPGMRIKKNQIHQEITEIYRSKKIPVPVRENIPIIGNSEGQKKILFTMFDPMCADYP